MLKVTVREEHRYPESKVYSTVNDMCLTVRNGDFDSLGEWAFLA